MRDIFEHVDRWVSEGQPFALATVTRTWGSAPRKPGAAMAVTSALDVAGSVSGGCIEGAVMEAAQAVLASGEARHLSFGVDDEDAWSVGLSCGGQVSVLVERFMAFSNDPSEQAVWQALRKARRQDRPAVLVSPLSKASVLHLLVSPAGTVVGEGLGRPEAAVRAALDAYAKRQSQEADIEGIPAFIQVLPRRDQMLVIGAGHIAVGLVRLGQQMGFSTVVVDPRSVFAAEGRFTAVPDQLLCQWPQDALPGLDLHEDTYAVLLTHDPKIDDPATHHLLRSPVAYIGALGSRKTQARRRDRLAAAGFTDADIARIHGPVGLDLGAQTPDEIALSIMAEVVQVKRNRARQA